MGELEEKLQTILGNPEAMGQIMSLAQSLGGGPGMSSSGQGNPYPSDDVWEDLPPDPAPDGDTPQSLFGELDPRLIHLGMQLLSEYSGQDEKKTALLAALRPFVKESRYAKVDQAIRIARMSRVIRMALEAFRKGDAGHV